MVFPTFSLFNLNMYQYKTLQYKNETNNAFVFLSILLRNSLFLSKLINCILLLIISSKKRGSTLKSRDKCDRVNKTFLCHVQSSIKYIQPFSQLGSRSASILPWVYFHDRLRMLLTCAVIIVCWKQVKSIRIIMLLNLCVAIAASCLLIILAPGLHVGKLISFLFRRCYAQSLQYVSIIFCCVYFHGWRVMASCYIS